MCYENNWETLKLPSSFWPTTHQLSNYCCIQLSWLEASCPSMERMWFFPPVIRSQEHLGTRRKEGKADIITALGARRGVSTRTMAPTIYWALPVCQTALRGSSSIISLILQMGNWSWEVKYLGQGYTDSNECIEDWNPAPQVWALDSLSSLGTTLRTPGDLDRKPLQMSLFLRYGAFSTWKKWIWKEGNREKWLQTICCLYSLSCLIIDLVSIISSPRSGGFHRAL